MDFHILGPLEVRDDDRELLLGGGKQRALLALLLIHPNEALSTDRLVEELWEESPPPTAARILHNYVSQLRRVLGNDRLQTQGRGYALRVEPGAREEIGRLDELHLTALIERIDADLALGRHVDLIGELETLVSHHPLQE